MTAQDAADHGARVGLSAAQDRISEQARDAAARVWACEQALRCAGVSAVLAWLPQVRPEQLRRLQMAAQNFQQQLFVMRPLAAQQEASPAVLRLALELKQVGRSCLKDFLGHSTMPVFLDRDSLEERLAISSHQPSAWDLESVLTYAWAVVETHGWAPRSNAHPTRDLVDQALGGGRHSAEVLASITGKLQQGSEMAPQIVTDLINGLHGDSGYEASLLSIVHAGVVDRRKHLGLAVSAIPAWRRLPQANPDPAEPQPARTISYAGQIGAKITLAGTITTAIWIDGYHHNSPPQRLIILDCGDAVAKMITTAAWADDIQRGDHLTVTATVKDHRDYRGTQQTLLVRPRRIDLPDTSTAASGSPSTPAWGARR